MSDKNVRKLFSLCNEIFGDPGNEIFSDPGIEKCPIKVDRVERECQEERTNAEKIMASKIQEQKKCMDCFAMIFPAENPWGQDKLMNPDAEIFPAEEWGQHKLMNPDAEIFPAENSWGQDKLMNPDAEIFPAENPWGQTTCMDPGAKTFASGMCPYAPCFIPHTMLIDDCARHSPSTSKA